MPHQILQPITARTSTHPVLSVYLDMSVNSDNKRTYQTFLNKQRARFAHPESDPEAHHGEPIGTVIERVEAWLADEFDTRSKGAAIFAEVGGDWFHAVAFARPFTNRLEVGAHPLIGPLRVALGNERRYCVAIVDREHLRVLSIYMDSVEEEKIDESETNDAEIEVQSDGHAEKEYEKWKAEETRKSFKTFAQDVESLGASRRADGYMVLGTDENVNHFLEFLSPAVADKVVHTCHAPPAAGNSDIIRFLSPVFENLRSREEASSIEELLSRVRQEHLATSGWHETLTELQEGKVDRLFIARDETKEGVQCTQCNFYLVRRDGDCPYCGGSLREGVDLVESAVRMAAGQDVRLAFIPADAMTEVDGVGALLKFR
ncbi:MAG: hypothetical protein ABIS27_14350 [Longimicrobiales bacterium]